MFTITDGKTDRVITHEQALILRDRELAYWHDGIGAYVLEWAALAGGGFDNPKVIEVIGKKAEHV